MSNDRMMRKVGRWMMAATENHEEDSPSDVLENHFIRQKILPYKEKIANMMRQMEDALASEDLLDVAQLGYTFRCWLWRIQHEAKTDVTAALNGTAFNPISVSSSDSESDIPLCDMKVQESEKKKDL